MVHEKENLLVLNRLNEFLKQKSWFDFDVLELRGGTLTLVGSIDLTSYHEVEVKFQDVFFIKCNSSWKTDTSQDAFIIPSLDEQRQVNIENSIEQDYFLFKIITEDQNSFYISSKQIFANFNLVRYNEEQSTNSNS